MILPVYWDLAAILLAREAQAFQPTMVMMDGVDTDRQPLLLELGSVNRAMLSSDGSDILHPAQPKGQPEAPILKSASKADELKGLFLSYGPVQDAANAAVQAHAGDLEAGEKLSDVLQGAKRAAFPREGNAYLCNNVTYVTNYLMSYPGKSVTLLQPSNGPKDGVHVAINADLRAAPRVFVHWPSTLTGKHLDAASDVMRAMIDAQLVALEGGKSPPVIGNNDMAEVLDGSGM
jgi:hypothetical protein